MNWFVVKISQIVKTFKSPTHKICKRHVAKNPWIKGKNEKEEEEEKKNREESLLRPLNAPGSIVERGFPMRSQEIIINKVSIELL